ncbi:hypothetical protein BB561_000256 [Smittium simulii]|uniref:Uncharacterized protein n=1 Tax=Smittium simulii TaxID=133385 RepID=A0A2T9YZU5_9FUNG|nr:hypothetical protein BB561_000256 [Smittium simulii]
MSTGAFKTKSNFDSKSNTNNNSISESSNGKGKGKNSGSINGISSLWQLYRREMSVNVFGFILEFDLEVGDKNLESSSEIQVALESLVQTELWVEGVLNGLAKHLFVLLGFKGTISITEEVTLKKQRVVNLLLQLLLIFTGQTSNQESVSFYTNPFLVIKTILIHSKTVDVQEVEKWSKYTICINAFDCIYSYAKMVYPNSIAIELIKLLECIYKISLSNKSKNAAKSDINEESTMIIERKLGKISKHLLQCADSDFKIAEMEYLLGLYIDYGNSESHVVLSDLVSLTLHEYMNMNEDNKNYFPSLDSKSISMFFKCTMTGLTRQFLKQGSKQSETKTDKLLPLCKIFHSIMLEARSLSSYKDVLLTSMRQGLIIVDVFSKKIIPNLEPIFLVYKDEIIQILFHLQKATRTMQIICGYSKVLKDLKITKLVPTVRRTLEAILFKVKALLKNNNCISAFEIGSLRHRNIQGEIISSQIPELRPKESKRRKIENDDTEASDISESEITE